MISEDIVNSNSTECHPLKGKRILVTGGAGYIGSHTVLELLKLGFEVTVVDNLYNSSEESLKRVQALAQKGLDFYNVDLLNFEGLRRVLKDYVDSTSGQSSIYGVIHFAGYKAVGESTKIPLVYYENNVSGTLNLLKAMKECGNVKRIIFSSSATVYGDPAIVPIPEECPLQPVNPYAFTKYFNEQIIRDVVKSHEDLDWSAVLLRYFNPVGADESGLIGEDPVGIPNNLMPFMAQVAVGRIKELSIYGEDYATVDGTGVRDYIHVTDLAKGHVAALLKLNETDRAGQTLVYNLGTGQGTSVKQMLNAFEVTIQRDIPNKVVGRREGDVAVLVANPSQANKELKWKAELTLERMCADLWRWQQGNPFGYKQQ